LRGEPLKPEKAGLAKLVQGEHVLENDIVQGNNLFNSPMSNSHEYWPCAHFGVFMTWSENGFSEFAFGLNAIMAGTYKPGHITSWYGMSWHDFRAQAVNATKPEAAAKPESATS
jgi:hypothetical protein